MRWLELAAGFACNCACPGCHSNDADPAKQMASEQAVRVMRDARAAGAKHFWFGGGEPTVRRDFIPLLKAARQLGFERIKVQTNGLLFAYPDAVARSVDAGMNEVNLLLKSDDPVLHDELMGRPGAHALLQHAIGNVTAAPLRSRLRVEADVLLTSRNCSELPSIVTSVASRGFSRVNAWLFATSATGSGSTLVPLVPAPDVLSAAIAAAVAAARRSGIGFVSLHTPHCLVSPLDWGTTFDPAAMGLHIVEPSGRGFLLSESEMERGAWGPGCEGCAVRGPCRGPRREYVALFGDSWVRPVSAADAKGHDPAGSVLDR